jgi:hypothetical protein
MAGQQHRDGESEHQAGELGRRHAQRAALVERHQGEPM